jgi:hypothetical protein
MAAVLKPRLEPQDDFTPPQIEVRELRTLEQAVALLDEWISAYAELERAYARLHHRYSKAKQYVDLLPPSD